MIGISKIRKVSELIITSKLRNSMIDETVKNEEQIVLKSIYSV